MPAGMSVTAHTLSQIRAVLVEAGTKTPTNDVYVSLNGYVGGRQHRTENTEIWVGAAA